MRAMYEMWYRYGTPPWVIGARRELVDLVESGRLPPGRAIDLGCGVGDNALFLAGHGFDVVGVDFAASAIEQARRKASDQGVAVDFRTADFFALPDLGRFDLVVDYGVCDDLDAQDRPRFRDAVRALLRPGGTLLSWCFEWELSLWERLLVRLLPFGQMAMAPGEVAALYADGFSVDRFAGGTGPGWPKGWAAYLVTSTPAGGAP